MLITNYLFKNLFKTTLFITIVITLVVLLTQSLKLLELIANSSASVYIFFKMFALTLPKLFEVVLPVSLAVTTLFTYNRMIMDNEIVVMRACGFNQMQLAKPVIYIGLASSLLMMLFSMWLTPVSVNELKQMRFDIRTKYSSMLLRQGVFNTFSDDLTVYIRSRDANGEMQGIMIHDSRDKDNPPVTITAKSGKLITDAGDYPIILVYNGMRQQIDKKTNSLAKLYFERYSIEIKGLSGTNVQRWRREDERSFMELLNPDIDNELDRNNVGLFIAEAHKRLVSPWNALAFTIISVATILFGSFSRRGHSKKIIIAVALIIIFQSLSVVFANLAKANNLAVPLMYINVIVPIFIGIFMLTAMGEAFINSVIFRKRKVDDIKDNIVKVNY